MPLARPKADAVNAQQDCWEKHEVSDQCKDQCENAQPAKHPYWRQIAQAGHGESEDQNNCRQDENWSDARDGSLYCIEGLLPLRLLQLKSIEEMDRVIDGETESYS